MSQSSEELKPQWNFLPAVIGWLVPGMGHFALGQRKRGIILCVCILSLWLSGILIGGISVIDRHDRDRVGGKFITSWWFYGQVMIAPTLAVDFVRDSMARSYSNEMGYVMEKNSDPRLNLLPVDEKADQDSDTQITNPPPYEPSFGRVAEQGTLYTALAGMLNLLAIIDVLYCDPRARRQMPVAAAIAPQSAEVKP